MKSGIFCSVIVLLFLGLCLQGEVFMFPDGAVSKRYPGTQITSEGIRFSGRGRIHLEKGLEGEDGKIVFTASFEPDKLKAGEKRKINYLLNFVSNRSTAAALTMNQYPGREKMLLTYFSATEDGKHVVCEANYHFIPGKIYKICLEWKGRKMTLSVDDSPLKAVSYSSPLKAQKSLIIGYPGHRQSMPMLFRSLKLEGKIAQDRRTSCWKYDCLQWKTVGENISVRRTGKRGVVIDFKGGRGSWVECGVPVYLKTGDNHIRVRGKYRIGRGEYGSMMIPYLNNISISPVRLMSGNRYYSPLLQFKHRAEADRMDFSVVGKAGTPYFFRILFYGNPSVVTLEEAEVFSDRIVRSGRPVPNPEKRDFSASSVDAGLAALKPARAEIRKGINRSDLVIDGKTCPPAIYRRGPHYPHWSRYREFGEAGINLYMFFAFFGKASSYHDMNVGGMWKGRNQYDFTKLDRELRTIYAINPDARVILVTSIEPYTEWNRDFPEAVFTNSRGEKGFGLTTAKVVYYGSRALEEQKKHPNEEFFPVPSNYGLEYRTEVCRAMGAMVRHLERNPAGKIVCGIHIIGGADGQFFPYDRDRTRGEDHSPSAKAAWKKYITEKYQGDVMRLRRAWGDSSVSFDSLKVPSAVERGQDFNTGQQPSPCGRDYVLFISRALTDLRLSLCRVIKKESGGRLLTGAYYPVGTSGNYHISDMLDSPDVDFLIDIRRAGVNGSFLLRNKLYIGELDLRVPDSMTPIFNYTYDQEMFRSVARHAAANAVQRSGGMYHLFDIGEAYYSKPETVRQFGIIQKGLTEGLDSRVGIAPQIGVFYDPAVYAGYSFMECNHLRQVLEHSVFHVLDHSGIPWQGYLAEDLLKGKISLPKILYFPSVPNFTEEEFRSIRQKARQSGSVLIWGYYRPYAAGKDSRIGGFEYLYPKENRNCPLSMATGRGFTAGLQGKVLGEVYTGFSYTGVFRMLYEIPAEVVAKPGDIVMAAYDFSRRPSMILTWRHGLPEIVNGAPGALSPAFFRNLAHFAGAEVLCDNDQAIVYSESGMLTVTCERGGKMKIRIPSGFSIKSSLSGHDYQISDRHLIFTAQNDGEVALFKMVRRKR